MVNDRVIRLMMRKIANLPTPKDTIVRVMIYDEGTAFTCSCTIARRMGRDADYWFESLEEAESTAASQFGIAAGAGKPSPIPSPAVNMIGSVPHESNVIRWKQTLGEIEPVI